MLLQQSEHLKVHSIEGIDARMSELILSRRSVVKIAISDLHRWVFPFQHVIPRDLYSITPSHGRRSYVVEEELHLVEGKLF